MKTGDFFKSKEEETGSVLKPKGYFVIRLDGKAFHTFTGKLKKPFDSSLSEAMITTTKALCSHVQNIKIAYTQSDEISLILSDLDEEKTQLWFEGKVQKMVSVAASVATATFNRSFRHPEGVLAFFDARVFRLETLEEVYEYLNWRRKDAYKNAVTLISLKHFSHKQIDKCHTDKKIEMIESKGDSVNNYHQGLLLGFIIEKEMRKLPFTNRKTQKTELVERAFWKEVAFTEKSVFWNK